MSAHALAGTGGSFSLTGHNARIMQWSATSVQDVNDCSGFTSAGWRENLPGMKVIRGNASGYMIANATATAVAADFSATGDSLTGCAFVLTSESGCTLTGTAMVSSITTGQGINGNGTVSFAFTSTGACTETWATS